MTAPRRRTGAALAAVLLVIGCGTAPPSSPPGQPSAPATLPPPASSPAPTSAPASLPAVVADPTLLDLLPLGGDGLILAYDPDTTARIVADPALVPDASALAVGLATLGRAAGLRTPGPLDDLAVVSVVRLRNPASDDEWFRDWRDTYDTAACAQAGGVARRAESAINGRTVFIGSCAGGAFTYHVRTDDGAIVVSVTSVGTYRIGERMLQRLAPPATIAP